MPIKLDVMRKDLRAMIKDMPVEIRYPAGVGLPIQASLNSGREMLDVLEPGMGSDETCIIVAVIDDFTKGLPQQFQLIDVKDRAGKWMQLEITETTGTNDPNAVDIIIKAGTPGARK